MNHLEKLQFPDALNKFHCEILTERTHELGALIGESDPPSRAPTRDQLQEVWTLIKDLPEKRLFAQEPPRAHYIVYIQQREITHDSARTPRGTIPGSPYSVHRSETKAL